MKALLDTHFVVWIVTGADRRQAFPWIDRYRPWGISPISMEIQFLAEIGRIDVQNPKFTETLLEDPRFVVDEVPMVSLIRRAIELTWTRDPFDRLITAHSSIRRLPLCTTDRNIRSFHRLLPPELASGTGGGDPKGSSQNNHASLLPLAPRGRKDRAWRRKPQDTKPSPPKP